MIKFAFTTIILLSTANSYLFGSAKRKAPQLSKTCAPVAVKNDFLGHLPQFKGKQYVSPEFSFDIDEVGQISNVVRKRSSGDSEFDEALSQAIGKWKYKPQPGCGVRSSTINISIQFLAK